MLLPLEMYATNLLLAVRGRCLLHVWLRHHRFADLDALSTRNLHVSPACVGLGTVFMIFKRTHTYYGLDASHQRRRTG